VTVRETPTRQAPKREMSDAPMAERRPPTVCQALHGLGVGGAEVLAVRLAERLGSSIRFVFVCLDELGTLGESLRGEGFPVHVLHRRPGLDWSCSRRFREVLKSERVNLIHAHQYTPFLQAALSRLGRSAPPILFTEHGRHHPDHPGLKRRLANRLLLRPRDRVVAVGEAVRMALIRNEGLPAKRVDVIYNGIPIERFDRPFSPEERADARREMGVGPDDLALIQVARLDYLKDHATALRALRRLADRLPRSRLVLVGEGPEEPAIRALTAELGLEGRVRMLGSRKDVPRLLAAADLALLTSISEGIPLTLIEAMAAGLPVVSTDVGGVAEVVVDQRTGLLAPSGGDSALADAIAALADDPEARRRMGALGRERARQFFSDQRMHAEYHKYYEVMINA